MRRFLEIQSSTVNVLLQCYLVPAVPPTPGKAIVQTVMASHLADQVAPEQQCVTLQCQLGFSGVLWPLVNALLLK